MGEGAPDYTHLRQILARDALGNLVPVACDPSGRIILLPYGTQTVSQDDPTRTIQGSDGLDLYTIAVDAVGRLIMLPYGWDGATYRPLKVDDEGRMIGVMKGQADVKWGLRGWWKFIASEGTTIKDYSGYGNNGDALSGAAAEAKYEDGVIGQALEFDGDNDLVTCGDADSIDIVGPITLEAWIYPTSITVSQTIMSKSAGTFTSIQFEFRVVDSTMYLVIADGISAFYASKTGILVDTWQHVVGVFDGTTLNVYLNCVVGTPVTLEGVQAETNEEFAIGARKPSAPSNFFSGLIDEPRVYARALSQDEINWRYANTNPAVGKPTRMIAVDNEGRMMVNIQDLPYKSRVLEHIDKILVPGGGVNLYSSYVPSGKAWVLTSILAYTDTADCDSIDLGIYDGSENHILSYIRAGGACQKVYNYGELILTAGDRINVGFTGLPLNAFIVLNINGYELDAP